MKQLLLALAVALVFLMGQEATAPPAPSAEAAPLGFAVQKSCTSNTVAIGATVTCTTTITVPNPICPCFTDPLVLTVAPQDTGNGPNPTYGRVVLQGTSTAIGTGTPVPVDSVVLVNPADGSPQTMTIRCVANFNVCDFFTPFDSIVITEVIQGAVGGVVTQTLTWPGNPFPPSPPDSLQTVTVLPATVGATVACLPNTIVNNSGAVGATNCTATFSDNDIFPTTVASGNVSITLTGSTAAVLTSTGTTTRTFRCGALPNSPQGCSAVAFSVQSNPPAPATAATTTAQATTAAATGPIGVQVTFTPDLPQVNGQLLTTVNNVLTVTPAAPGPVPNTPASLTVAGPASIACGATGSITATLRDAGGTLVAAPTQVGFSTSLGTIASPVMTAAGVATTTLAAPATGSGGSALVTATSGALTAQTLVPLTACAGTAATASVSVTAPTLAIACGTVGTITATLRDAGGAVVAAPTQVNFSTSAGVIASPVTTTNGVATTTLAAPALGAGGTAVITATAAGVTSQAVVALGACASTPSTTTTTQPSFPYVPYYPPPMPYYPPPPVVQQPAPPQPIINIYNVLPTPIAQAVAPQPSQNLNATRPVATSPAAPMQFKPPNTGDAGLKVSLTLGIVRRPASL